MHKKSFFELVVLYVFSPIVDIFKKITKIELNYAKLNDGNCL